MRHEDKGSGKVTSTSTRDECGWVLLATAFSCGFQLIWFGSRAFHQIDIDGIDYIGIARHLRSHQFYAAINDFRSPLLSWLIAIGSFFGRDWVSVGKVVSIASFLLCLILLYFFTRSLFHSDATASWAVLWFSLCRGLMVQSIDMVTPDFLFAALTLVYFIVLLRCLRGDGKKQWVLLGGVHALAFLAKGFALPWLGVVTIAAVLLSRSVRQWAPRIALAFILPVIVAAGWAGTLHYKYGTYTTGTQLKFNYLQWSSHPDVPGPYAFLKDTKPYTDEDNVNDPMPPGNWLWQYRIGVREAAPELAKHEVQNLPKAIKELLIVVTPGGLLAFGFAITFLFRRREEYPIELTMAVVLAFAICVMLVTYCSLVFDSRYLYPVIPPLLAFCVFFLRQSDPQLRVWRRLVGALIVLGILFTLVYSSSPFRVMTRDFQTFCYQTGQRLRAHPGSTVVSVGSGPYPEHGVGWEAGYKSAYFGDRRLIGAIETLPDASQLPGLMNDISKAKPDAVLVWGSAGDARYEALTRELAQTYGGTARQAIIDPVHGEIGSALYLSQP